MVYSLPLTVIVFVFLTIRRAWTQPLETYVLQTDGELGHLVPYFELVRGDEDQRSGKPIVLVLDFPRHAGFDELYASGLGWRILWPKRASGLLSQALLLQPRFVLSEIRLNPNHQKNVFRLAPKRGEVRASHMARTKLEPTPKLIDCRQELLRSVGFEATQYVLVAVFTRAWEEASNPQYALKTRPLESNGAELAGGIDFLHKREFGVIMVGSEDTGESRVARRIPRLKNIGRFGGLDEVALASGCKFLWSDGVGAAWLGKPFSRPTLTTNHWFLGADSEGCYPATVVPLRYQRPNGRTFTLREMLEDTSLFKQISPRGELLRVRNTSEEIVEALEEMTARVEGTYVEDEESRTLQARAAEIYAEYPRLYPFVVVSSFLKRHPDMLN